MLSVNLKVPEQMNEQRKLLDVTWRDVLIAGLKALQSTKSMPCIHPIEFRHAYPGIVICLKCGEQVC